MVYGVRGLWGGLQGWTQARVPVRDGLGRVLPAAGWMGV